MSSASAASRVLFGSNRSGETIPFMETSTQSRPLEIGGLRLSVALFGSFEAVKPLWLRLEESAELSPFQCFEWCRQFWLSGVKSAHAKLDIIAATSADGDLVLLMPLVTSRRAGALVAEMLADTNAAHRAPYIARDLLEALAAKAQRGTLFSAIRALTGADVLVLEQQPQTVLGTPHPLLGPSAVDHREEITDALFTQGTWEEFDRAHRSSKSRSRDKRRLEGLASLGPVSLYSPQTLLERQAFLEEILSRKTEDLKSRGVHVFEEPATRDFLMRIAALDRATSSIWPDFLGLRVGDRWAAAHFGVIHGKTAAGLIIAMGVPEAREHSPGHLMIQSVMKHVFEAGVTRYSFGLGASDLKTRWADERMPVFSDAIALSPLGWPYAQMKRALWWAKREIKHRPRLFEAATRTRAAVHRIKAMATI